MLFDSINYLQKGSAIQQNAYRVLSNHKIFEKLQLFDPILAGTIPLNISVENSDLDIICCFQDQIQFEEVLKTCFSDIESFSIRELKEINAIVANFSVDDFEVEIFGQVIPVKQQNAYRHMLAEYLLLELHGETFRQKVIELKRQGMKTEPAFAHLLNLKGDPYQALLKFE